MYVAANRVSTAFLTFCPLFAGLILVMVSIYVTRSNLTGFQFRWLPKRAIWGLTSLSGLTWGLVMELMLRVLDLLKARCRGIGTGVDILPTSQSKTSWSTHLRQTLLGRLPWQERLPYVYILEAYQPLYES